jgi:hypothetical protein
MMPGVRIWQWAFSTLFYNDVDRRTGELVQFSNIHSFRSIAYGGKETPGKWIFG